MRTKTNQLSTWKEEEEEEENEVVETTVVSQTCKHMERSVGCVCVA